MNTRGTWIECNNLRICANDAILRDIVASDAHWHDLHALESEKQQRRA